MRDGEKYKEQTNSNGLACALSLSFLNVPLYEIQNKLNNL
jgi:hypothetical protein